METLSIFQKFQDDLIGAYVVLQAGDRKNFNELASVAHLNLRNSSRILSKRESALLRSYAEQCALTLHKCFKLGLRNLSRRLKEYRYENELLIRLNKKGIAVADASTDDFMLAA